jgi:hypothetical protein
VISAKSRLQLPFLCARDSLTTQFVWVLSASAGIAGLAEAAQFSMDWQTTDAEAAVSADDWGWAAALSFA